MPIYASTGEVYEDEQSYLLNSPVPKTTEDASQKASISHTEPRTDVSSTAPLPQYQAEIDPNVIGSTEMKSGADRYQLWPEKMVRDFATKFSNSKQFLDQYMEGKVAHDDPNLVNAITTLTSTVAGAGLASAPLRTSSVGTFGGKVGLSRIEPNTQEMMGRLEKALPDEEITKLTGMWRGKDNQWRYEIPDKDAKLNEQGLRSIVDDKPPEGHTSSQALEWVLKHDVLYEYYPELKNYRVEYDAKGVSGLPDATAAFYPDTKRVVIGPAFAKLPKSDQTAILLHEIQHGLQEIEGFATGTNKLVTPSGVRAEKLKKEIDKADTYYRNLIEAAESGEIKLTPKQQGELPKAKEYIKQIEEAYDELDRLRKNSFQEYLDNPGESEARAVEDAYYKSIGILNLEERRKAAKEFQEFLRSKKAK